MRRVRIVARRYAAARVARRPDWRRARPKATSTSRPATRSRKWWPSTASARHWRRVDRWVCSPTRIMNSGISGTVSADDQPGERVGDQDPDRDGGRDDRGDEQRGQVAAEVALEPVEPAGGQRGQLAGRRQAGVAGAEPQDVRDQGGPQGAHDVGRRAVRGDLARPRQPAPGRPPPRARRAGRRRGRAGPPRRGTRCSSTPGQQLGLHHDQTRGRYGEGGGRDDEPPRGRRVPQQPRVEGFHRDAGTRRTQAGVGRDVGRADAAAEHPERPGLVGQHDRGEHGRDPGHDRQRVRRGRGVGGGQAEGRVGAGGQHVRVERAEQRDGHRDDRHAS